MPKARNQKPQIVLMVFSMWAFCQWDVQPLNCSNGVLHFRLQYGLTQNRMFIKTIEAFEKKLEIGMTTTRSASTK